MTVSFSQCLLGLDALLREEMAALQRAMRSIRAHYDTSQSVDLIC